MFRPMYIMGVVLGLLITLSATAGWQGRMTPNDAIDVAGMQRMLSQRILKAYCELGLREFHSKPQEQLNQALSLFEANLLKLEGFITDADVLQALNEVKRLWPQYKAIASDTPDQAGAAVLLEINHQLLPLTHAVVVKMEQSFGTSTGKWVNLAGRQRMLSQRMAMFYLLRLWGVQNPGDAERLEKAHSDFEAAIAELRSFPGNTPETLTLLDGLHRSVRWLAKTMSEKEGNYSFLVATISERMLEDADQLTSLYAKLERQQ